MGQTPENHAWRQAGRAEGYANAMQDKEYMVAAVEVYARIRNYEDGRKRHSSASVRGGSHHSNSARGSQYQSQHSNSARGNQHQSRHSQNEVIPHNSNQASQSASSQPKSADYTRNKYVEHKNKAAEYSQRLKSKGQHYTQTGKGQPAGASNNAFDKPPQKSSSHGKGQDYVEQKYAQYQQMLKEAPAKSGSKQLAYASNGSGSAAARVGTGSVASSRPTERSRSHVESGSNGRPARGSGEYYGRR